MLNEESEKRKTLSQEIAILLAKDPRVHRIVLFGSSARGTAGPNSDTDILWTTKSKTEEPVWVQKELLESLVAECISQDIVDKQLHFTYLPDRGYRRPTKENRLFVNNVKREGITLFLREEPLIQLTRRGRVIK